MSRLQELKKKKNKKIPGSLTDFFAREHASKQAQVDALLRLTESGQITISVHVREEAAE